jgi:D-alanyl-D-alanine carboxypeptidase
MLGATLGVLALLAGSSLPAAESAAPPVRAEAGLLIDLSTGQVLYAKNPEGDRAPASLVKMMTLYLAFEDLGSDRVTLEDPVAVSANAAQTPRFRIGLAEGGTVPLRTLLAMVAVASANDAATAVAEHLAGSEEAFVARMNATGARLGLTSTVFANPHGLPDPAQRTTARDMALLAERLIADFRESRELLGETDFTWQGHAYRRNRIPLFQDPGGVTALKTGYTLEAGYNLAVAARKAGQRLLCIILGAETRSRSFLEAARLLKFGFRESLGTTGPAPRRSRSRSGVQRVTPR